MEEEAGGKEELLRGVCHVRLLSALYARKGTGPCNTHLRTRNNECDVSF